MRSILYDFTPAELQFLLDTSNSYSDLLRKLSMNPKGGNPETLKKIITEYNLDETKLNENRSNLLRQNANLTHKKISMTLQDVFDGKYTKVQSGKLLDMLVNENIKEYKCECCGISSWNDKPLRLQLHHKDGNHNNNNLNNLQILCPNCHTQTDNYGGKSSRCNVKKSKEVIQNLKKDIRNNPPITREDLKLKIRNSSFVSIAREYGVSDNAVRKWCDKYQLPRQKRVINLLPNDQWEKL